MLIDSHCHLDSDKFSGEIQDVVNRAQAAGVEKLITISTQIRDFHRVLSIAERFENVYCSVGTHPDSAMLESEFSVSDIVDLTNHAKVVAIGETGLDYHYDGISKEAQKKVFINHIQASRITGLPLVIHTRDADVDMEEILREEISKGQFPFIFHCFSSGLELAKAGLELGGYISFSGILTFRNAEPIRHVAKVVPHNRLLVETDAPYLAPVPFRGKRNEPAYVANTAAVLADVVGISAGQIAKITTENAQRVFSKMIE